VPDPANQPPALTLAQSTWTDENGDLWMWGGYTTLPFPNQGHHNAMWRYHIATNTWTWMNGANVVNNAGSYGTVGVPAGTNLPKGRYAQSLGKGADGSFWIYGGVLSGNFRYRDLWRYEPTVNRWTWMGGGQESTNPQVAPTYGVECADDAENTPGSRRGATWRDGEGRLWLFGEATESGSPEVRSDLWTFCTATNTWAWVAGPNTLGAGGNWGVMGVSSPNNVPNGRFFPATWTGADGSLYLFGGNEVGLQFQTHNDLWRFVPDAACAPCTVASGTAELNEATGVQWRVIGHKVEIGVPAGEWWVTALDPIGRRLGTAQGQSVLSLDVESSYSGPCVVVLEGPNGSRKIRKVFITD